MRMIVRRVLQRKNEAESTALARPWRRRGDLATVSPHDGFADVQSQAAALESTSALSAIELTEDACRVLGAQADAPIRNLDPHGLVFDPHAHVDAPAVRAVLHRVGQ